MPGVGNAIAGLVVGLSTGAAAAAGAASTAFVIGMNAGAALAGMGILGNLLGSVALSALQTALAQPKQSGGITITSTVVGEHNPETVILGWTPTGGAEICPAYSHGARNKFITHVVELCSAPGATLERVIFDDDYVELGSTPHPDYGLPVLGDYEGFAWIKYYDGSQTAADAMMVDKYGAHPDRPWTQDAVGAGLCYAILTFKYHQKKMNALPSVRFELLGIPLYDPRADDTVGGDGGQRWDDPSTWTQTTNAMLVAWNIMRGLRLPGGRVWGGRTEAEDLHPASWWAAISACDLPRDGESEPQYQVGIEVPLSDEPAKVIAEILKSADAQIADCGGTWKTRVGGPGLPIWAHTDDAILRSQDRELDPWPELQKLYNAVQATHPDPAAIWETRDAPGRYNAEWEAADRVGRRTAELTFAAVPWPVQVQQLMASYIATERRWVRHGHTLAPESAILEPLDCIAWTSERNGYAAKLFELSLVITDIHSCLQQIGQREVDHADTAWSAGDALATTPSVPGSTLAPLDAEGIAITGGAVTDSTGASRRPAIIVTWEPEDFPFDALNFRVRFAGSSDAGWTDQTSDLDRGRYEISAGLVAGEVDYEVSVLVVADRPADWSDWYSVTVEDIRLGTDDLADQAVTKTNRVIEPAEVPEVIYNGSNWVDYLEVDLGATTLEQTWDVIATAEKTTVSGSVEISDLIINWSRAGRVRLLLLVQKDQLAPTKTMVVSDDSIAIGDSWATVVMSHRWKGAYASVRYRLQISVNQKQGGYVPPGTSVHRALALEAAITVK